MSRAETRALQQVAFDQLGSLVTVTTPSPPVSTSKPARKSMS